MIKEDHNSTVIESVTNQKSHKRNLELSQKDQQHFMVPRWKTLDKLVVMEQVDMLTGKYTTFYFKNICSTTVCKYGYM